MRSKTAPTRVRARRRHASRTSISASTIGSLCPDRAVRTCASPLGRSSASQSQASATPGRRAAHSSHRVGLAGPSNGPNVEYPGPIPARGRLSRRIRSASFLRFGERLGGWAHHSSSRPLPERELHHWHLRGQAKCSSRFDSYSASARAAPGIASKPRRVCRVPLLSLQLPRSGGSALRFATGVQSQRSAGGVEPLASPDRLRP